MKYFCLAILLISLSACSSNKPAADTSKKPEKYPVTFTDDSATIKIPATVSTISHCIVRNDSKPHTDKIAGSAAKASIHDSASIIGKTFESPRSDNPTKVKKETWYPDFVYFDKNGQFQIEGKVIRKIGTPGDGDEIRFEAKGDYSVVEKSKSSGETFNLKGQVRVYLELETSLEKKTRWIKDDEHPFKEKIRILQEAVCASGSIPFTIINLSQNKEGLLFTHDKVDLMEVSTSETP